MAQRELILLQTKTLKPARPANICTLWMASLAAAILCLTIPSGGTAAFQPLTPHLRPLTTPTTGGTRLAQDEAEENEVEVPPADVEKYISVYKAMQRNHSLTVEQAAAAQGLTLKAFRDIEGRIERNDSLREQVRGALKAAAKASPQPTSSPSPR
jgi:hypothetical protein